MSDKFIKHINGKKNKIGSTNKKKRYNPGFIVAMAICFVAIGAASFSTYRNINDYMNPVSTASDSEEQSTANESESLNANHNVGGIFDTASHPSLDILISDVDTNMDADSDNYTQTDSDVSINEDVYTDSENVIVSDTYLFPVGQEVINEFSGNDLVYSKTMTDWRVHLGTDFYAEKGTKVKPITTGVVTEIYTDGLLGVTVVIDHGNSVKAYYSGLGSTTLVSVGDSVGVGDFIGSVNVVPSESLEEPHLHLSIKVDDEWINPMDLLQN